MEHIEKRVRNGKRLLIAMLILLIIWCAFGPVTIINQLLPIEIIMPVMAFSFIITGITYLRRYRSIRASYKLTKKYVKRLELEDFSGKTYDLPLSKIAFGNEVFYSDTSGALLPYSIVSWAYIHQVKSYGDVIAKFLIVKCLNGTTAQLKVAEEEIVPLLRVLAEKQPNLIVGYDVKQIELYDKAKRTFKLEEKNKTE